MITTLLQVPAWIVGTDNRPSFQAWETILNEASLISLNADTIEQPSLDTIEIQSTVYGLDVVTLNSFNLIKYKDTYYNVTDLKVVQDGESQGIAYFKGTINIYLTFIVTLFNEHSYTPTTVYFSKKHMNRWKCYDNNYDNNESKYVNFSQQYYLRTIPKQLENVGKSKYKTQYCFNPNDYNSGANDNGINDYYTIQTANASVLDNQPISTCLATYVVLKPVFSGTFSTPPNNELNFNWGYGFLNVGQLSNGADPNSWTNSCTMNDFLPIYNTNPVIAGEQYLDLAVFPLPLSLAMVKNPVSDEYMDNPNYVELSAFNHTVYENLDSSYWKQNVVMQGQTYYLYNVVAPWLSTSVPNVYVPTKFGTSGQSNAAARIINQINKYFALNPVLFAFCNLVAHLNGQDSIIDLTSFDNVCLDGQSKDNLQTNYCFLFGASFQATYPTAMITNVMASEWANLWTYYVYNKSHVLIPWGYNQVNDAIYSLPCSMSLSVPTDAWNDYYTGHKNAYKMGVSVAELVAQQSQANAVTTGITTIKGGLVMDDGDGSIIRHTIEELVNGTIGATNVTEGTMSAASQQLRYNYQKSGMRKDMSRVTNERLATHATPFTLDNYAMTWVFESLTDFDYYYVANYFAMNGFEVGRWIPWKYWNNRKFWNYIQAIYVSDTMFSFLNTKYKLLIDAEFNKGFRVINKAFLELLETKGYSWMEGLNFQVTEDIVGSFFNNPELLRFSPNEEIDYISNQTYEQYAKVNPNLAVGNSTFNPWCVEDIQTLVNKIVNDIINEVNNLFATASVKLNAFLIKHFGNGNFTQTLMKYWRIYWVNRYLIDIESNIRSWLVTRVTDMYKLGKTDVANYITSMQTECKKIVTQAVEAKLEQVEAMFEDTCTNFLDWGIDRLETIVQNVLPVIIKAGLLAVIKYGITLLL